MADQLARKGHEVRLVNFPHAERRETLGLLHHQVPDGVELVEFARAGSQLFRNIGLMTNAAKGMDIVHLWKSYPDAGLPAIYAAYRNDLPLHYDWDDYEEDIAYELTGSRGVARLTRTWEHQILRFPDSVSTASQELKRLAVERGMPSYRIWDAPVGADLERFHPHNDGASIREEYGLTPPVLVYVGQLEVANFPEQCLGVLEAVRREHGGASLLIVGGGRKQDELKAQVERRGLVDAVRLTGYLPQEMVPLCLAAADVALAPFDDTPVTRCKSPLKIVEYLASGTPVVAGDVGEARRMIGTAGRCAPPGDEAKLAAGVLEVLADDVDYTTLARSRAVQIYNWERTTSRLIEAYEFAISGTRPNPSRDL